MKKSIISFGIAVLIGIFLTELTLSLSFRVDDPYHHFKSVKQDMEYIESQFYPRERYTFYPEAELPEMARETHFTTNNLGFRGPDLIVSKPAGEYRIFMVGGSTTECLYLDDDATITARLQAYLDGHVADSVKVRVYNAGKSGDKSFDHVAMISQRIIHLQPDMIIVFAGINDLLAAVGQTDYIHLPDPRRTTYSFFDMAGFFLTEFQIPRRVYYLLHENSAREIGQALPFHSGYKYRVASCRSFPLSDESPPIDLQAYENNLRTIMGIAEAHQVRLLFMTQATTWNSRIDPGSVEWHWLNRGDSVRYSEKSMDRALEAYNDVMRRLAGASGLPLFDLARVLPKSREFIYDDCHFNIKGAQTAASFLGLMLISDNLLN